MTSSYLARAIAGAAATCMAVTGFATAASAEETAATVSLGTTNVLTLPAGDGVRDTTNLSVTADVPTTVSFAIRAQDSDTALVNLGDIEVTDPGILIEVGIPITGLPAGALEVVATPTVGEPTTTPLTVGSGVPTDVSLSLTNTTIFTWTGGAPRSTNALVSATDETGLTVPFTGSVTATVGAKVYTTPIASTTGDEASAYIGVSKLAAGTGTVTATVHGASPANVSSDPVTLTVLPTAVKTVALSRSLSIVYPSKDGYKDFVKFSVASTSTTGETIPVTGKVTITRNGTVVKSWSLYSNAAWTGTWDGKVAGKIVGGTYYVKVSIKGPEGITKSATTSVLVDTGRLVSKLKTVTYKPGNVFHSFNDYSASGYGTCWYNYVTTLDVHCEGYSAYYDPYYSLTSASSVTIPSDVVASQKYGSPRASVSMHVTYLAGYADWGYDATTGSDTYEKFGYLYAGTNSLGAFTIAPGSTRVYIGFGLEEYSDITIDTMKVNYSYKVMTH